MLDGRLPCIWRLQTMKRYVYPLKHVCSAIERANRNMLNLWAGRGNGKRKNEVTKAWHFTTTWRRHLQLMILILLKFGAFVDLTDVVTNAKYGIVKLNDFCRVIVT